MSAMWNAPRAFRSMTKSISDAQENYYRKFIQQHGHNKGIVELLEANKNGDPIDMEDIISWLKKEFPDMIDDIDKYLLLL